ncbi:WXG100 family type VII secretion target [Saccharomonospora azurea]|uniref:WXG100 family type VII secretion target n=1 Tax=Saccharomonospora azurea TaxID=40988 RepID=UPI0033168CF6
MTDDSLVAPVESSRKPWTGIGLADGIEGLITSIQNQDWISGALAGVGLSLEAVSTALDPFSSLLSSGISWAMEYFEPLREILDELTGIPDVVMSHAATWNNMAEHLGTMAEDLSAGLESDLPGWQGGAAEAYHAMMANNVEAVGGLAAISAAMASATEGAGGLVQMTREIVRDLIADLVARVIVWAAEAIFVVTIPVIAAQITAAVVKWTGRIFTFITSLIDSLTNLSKLLNG